MYVLLFKVDFRIEILNLWTLKKKGEEINMICSKTMANHISLMFVSIIFELSLHLDWQSRMGQGMNSRLICYQVNVSLYCSVVKISICSINRIIRFEFKYLSTQHMPIYTISSNFLWTSWLKIQSLNTHSHTHTHYN